MQRTQHPGPAAAARLSLNLANLRHSHRRGIHDCQQSSNPPQLAPLMGPASSPSVDWNCAFPSGVSRSRRAYITRAPKMSAVVHMNWGAGTMEGRDGGR